MAALDKPFAQHRLPLLAELAPFADATVAHRFVTTLSGHWHAAAIKH
jgi:hypothetical protein